MTTVPRVASSLDDLRVGQVVTFRNLHIGKVTMLASGAAVAARMHEFDGLPTAITELDALNGYVVILSDPEPEPVSVSRAAINRLAAPLTFQIDEPQGDSSQPALLRQVLAAARALLDEVRAQEPTP